MRRLALVSLVLCAVSAQAAAQDGFGGSQPRPNPPPPVVSYGSDGPSAPRGRLAPPPYTGPSQRITSARQAYPRKPPVRRRARPEVSSFTGICRGC